MSVLIKLAQQALQQAEQMEQLAQDDDWEGVTNLQVTHNQTVSRLMTAEIPAEEVKEVRQILLTTKETNNRTMQLAEQVKQKLVKDKKTLGQAAKMQKALDAFR
ncbi:hypothetical protein [Neptuniibacter halophilus]|uniref:hypothetical protein n=1 Tax=Neptuniibacter halophilus TaxID=651666 RepID=UPI0025733D67|nr:hypothetical protein [Neptuniibacter halophilus]